jgi:hypothetical protein
MLKLSLFIIRSSSATSKRKSANMESEYFVDEYCFPSTKQGKKSTNKGICTTLLHKPCDEWRQRTFLALAFWPSVWKKEKKKKTGNVQLQLVTFIDSKKRLES